MDGTKFKRMMAVFEEVADLPPERRPDLIRDRCAGDPELKVAVVAMLAEAGRPDAAMKTGQGVVELARGGVDEHTLSPTLAIERADEPIPVLSGHFRILRIIGEGGMGTVYEAEQRMPRRIVALKAIRRGMATPGMMRRFQQEAQILARLQHPGIAHLYEVGVAGEHDPGQAFIAMELVRGRPLNEHTVERALDLPAKLELMAQVCDAVHHAHQRGVIHRDLKPSNILVDETGQPKILDFGVARATDALPIGGVGGTEPLQTGVGQLIGTLPYMSPEQVAAEPDGVDVRTDVYALGVLLYELLAGRQPLDLGNRPLHEAARMIREEEPARLGKLDPKLRGDVEIIVVRALEKNKARRYQSAAELRDELRRCIRGEAIHARRDSAIYVLRKQMWRHRVAVGAVSGVVIGVSAFGIHSSIQADRQRLLAQQERDAKLAAVVAQGVAEREHNRANREAAALRDTLYFSRIGFADSAYSGGDAERMRRVLHECPVDQRGWEWRYLARLADQSTRTIQCYDPGQMGFSYTPGRSTIYAWRIEGHVIALRAADGERLAELDTGRPLTAFAESPDGRLLASGDHSGLIVVQEADTGKIRASWTAAKVAIRTLQFDPEGVDLLASTTGAGAAIWNPLTGDLRRRLTPPDELTTFTAYSPDGQVVAAGRPDWTITLIIASTGEEIVSLRGHEATVQRGAFSRDGSLFISGSEDRTARVWDVSSGEALSVVRGHANKVLAVDFSPDGRLAVSGGTEGVLRITDARTGKDLQRLLGHESTVIGACFIPDGSAVISGSRDGTIRWWSMREQEPVFDPDAGPIRALAFDPAGSSFMFGAEESSGRCDWQARPPDKPASKDDPAAWTLAIAPDGKSSFQSGPEMGVILARRAGEPASSRLIGHAGYVLDLACSPDSRRLVSASEDRSARIWDVESGRELIQLIGHQNGVAAVVWGEGVIYTGSWDGTIRAWNPDTGEQVRSVDAAKPRRGAVMSMCLARDAAVEGRSLLVACGEDGYGTVWDAGTFERLATLRGHKGPVNCVVASPDGVRVATGGFDNTVRVWDPRSGAELLTLRGHLWSVRAVAFSPDGSTLVSGASDRTIRFWQARAP